MKPWTKEWEIEEEKLRLTTCIERITDIAELSKSKSDIVASTNQNSS
jgi:hypothetical protein